MSGSNSRGVVHPSRIHPSGNCKDRQIRSNPICDSPAQGCEATVTAIQPAGRFGALGVDGDRVTSFQEKPQGDNRWINGGFMVCEPSVLDRLDDDSTIFEQAPLEGLARDRQLALWKHSGFWMAMDTLRDKTQLEEMWAAGRAPWKTWESLRG